MYFKIIILVFIPILFFSFTNNNIKTNSSKSNVCFEYEILPIFKNNCGISGCHNADSKKSGYVLTSFLSITEKGIIPKKPEKSPIYQVLLPNSSKPMPPKPHKSLRNDEIELIKKWIVEGAKKEKCQ